MMLHTLSLKKVTKYFTQGEGTIKVLDTVSIIFEQNSSYAITGVSGSGKSTLLHVLAGLDSASSGHVFYDTHDIALLSERDKDQFLNKSVGLVFQSPYLIRELSVLENVILSGLIAQHERATCIKKGRELLKQVNLIEKESSKPASLSGGQQQRVALARALYNEPAFLLADEPTGGLDMHTGMAIIELIMQLQKEWQMGVIISTHDAYVANYMQTIYILQEGTLKT